MMFIVTEGLPAGAGTSEREALEAVLRRHANLYVNAEQQLRTEEQVSLKAARKAENATRRKACPSLADVPWLQRLTLEQGVTMDPYDMGRRLAVAVRVDDTQLHGSQLEQLARKLLASEGAAVVRRVKDDIAAGNTAQMWSALHAFQKHTAMVFKALYNEARALAVLYPGCILVTELCAGRDQQVGQLSVMFDQITKMFTEDEGGQGETWLLGCWDSFFEGFEVNNAATAAVHASILQRGQAVLGGSGVGLRAGPAGVVSFGAWGGGISGGGATAQAARLVSFAPGTSGGAGAPSAAVAAGGGGGSGGGAGAKPQGPTAGANRLTIQKHAPVSEAIIGRVIGIAAPASTCWECNVAGHYKGECPVAWGRLGHALPGWTKDGQRKAADWSNGEPRRKTYKEWVRFLRDSTCFPAGKAEFVALVDAPDMDKYLERARVAPP